MSEEPHIYDWYQPFYGKSVDLNDPKTYEDYWFSKYTDLSARKLREAIHNAFAFSLYYSTILHPDWDRSQHRRVEGMARAFAREFCEPDRFRNAIWLRKQLFLILDETENQC